MSYRAGIIGCGGIAGCHARAYRSDARMALVAGAEPKEDRRTKFQTDFGISVYASAREMLDRERLDVVSICTPHPTHHAMTLLAAQAGPKAILCEKPIAMDLAEADEMIRVCKQQATRLIIGHQRRFQPLHLAVATPVLHGEIGRLTDIYFEMPYWDLMSWGTHAIDLIRWCNHDSPAVSVFGQVDLSAIHERFGQQVEDSYLVHVRFENGVAATIASGPIIKLFHQRIVGDQGYLFFEEIWGEHPKYTIWTQRYDGPRVMIPRPEPDDWQIGFDREVRALGDSLETGAPHILNAESARETLAIIMATYESSRRREVIRFPVSIPDNPLLAMLANRSV